MPIIQSVDRAFKILDLFNELTPELKISEISLKLDLNKSTVHSLLKTLKEHDYIRQNPESGKYSLGMKLVERVKFLDEQHGYKSDCQAFLSRTFQ